jgi:hypothetical protein
VKHVRSFVRFWWDFVVGDDPRVAVGLAAALAATWLLEDHGISVWWLLPAAVAVVLTAAVVREARRA